MTKKKIEKITEGIKGTVWANEEALYYYIQSIIEKLNELVDSHNESVENEEYKKQHDCSDGKRQCMQGDCKWHPHTSPICHQASCKPTTPEKKCCEKCRDVEEELKFICTKKACPCHQKESEKREECKFCEKGEPNHVHTYDGKITISEKRNDIY